MLKARGTVVLVAFLLATTATAAMFLYLRGVKKEASNGPGLATVIVAKQDIPAGSDLDRVIADGVFTTAQVTKDSMVRGAVTTLSELKGRQTSQPILAGEQITTARLRGSQELAGGTLGIPKGYEAVTMPLDVSRAVGGLVQPGDHVTIWATFQGTGVVISGKPAPGQADVTVSLVPDVEVLKATRPSLDKPGQDYVYTMALRPGDAQKVVFATENGTVWLGLLPPNQHGAPVAPVTIGKVVK